MRGVPDPACDVDRGAGDGGHRAELALSRHGTSGSVLVVSLREEVNEVHTTDL